MLIIMPNFVHQILRMSMMIFDFEARFELGTLWSSKEKCPNKKRLVTAMCTWHFCHHSTLICPLTFRFRTSLPPFAYYCKLSHKGNKLYESLFVCLQCVPRRTAGPAKACVSMGKLTILSSELSYLSTFLSDFGQIAICFSELRFAFMKALGELWGVPGWLLAALGDSRASRRRMTRKAHCPCSISLE